VVGMGAIVLHDAHVGAGAILAAGAVVPDRGTVGAGMLAAGVPAREKKRLDGATAGYPQRAADEYQELRERYLASSTVRESDDDSVPAS
jgi:carbonic anhydrase/acetyltransferase-like protein (isoleucine patch superfamily)